jgi:hypothetical protein
LRDLPESLENGTAKVVTVTKCPCCIADEPCHPNCTCVQPYSSSGCWCCATYGGKVAANFLVEQARKRHSPDRRALCDEVCDALECLKSQQQVRALDLGFSRTASKLESHYTDLIQRVRRELGT